MITVRILRGTVADGRPLACGEMLALNDAEAQYLIAVGKAERATVQESAVTEPETLVETAERKAPLKRRR